MKRVTYYTDRQRDALTWTAKVIDFGVSLTVVAAFNELFNAYVLLRDHPGLFRREVKHLARLAEKKARMRRNAIDGNMRSKEFFEDYSDRVIDLAGNDVTLFRISIKQTLDDARAPDAELLSYAETARVMLDMAAVQYEAVIGEGRRRGAGTGLHEAFGEYHCRDVARAWQRTCDLLYAGQAEVNLNTQRSQRLFQDMCGKFADGHYVSACLEEARRLHPEFSNGIGWKSQ